MTKQEMNNILNDIDNTINNSKYSYKEYADKQGYSLKQEIQESQPWTFDGEELGYSSYTIKNVIPEELQYNPSDSFQIGNNKKGGV